MCSNQKNKTKKISEKLLNETDISNLTDKEFKVIVLKVLTEFREKMMIKHSENFNKEIEKNQTVVFLS